jgi:outer membrane receptor protein involved in Fe transport
MIWIALLGFGAAGVTAQPKAGVETATAADRVVYQDTVVVRATRLGRRLGEFPGSITVIEPRDVRRQTTRGLHELMRDVPGLNLYDLSGGGSGGQVESRGFTSLGLTSHVRVLVDEIPINDVEGDRVDWNLLSVAQVDRVELLRGPSSFLYGNAAMAGVINLVTRDASTGVRPWAQVTGGSGPARGAAGGTSFAARGAEGAVSGSYHNSDGLRDHSGAENWSAYGHIRMRVGGRWAGRVRLLAHRGIQQVPGALPAPVWWERPRAAGTPDDYRDHQAVNGSIEISNPVADRLRAAIAVAVDLRRLDARETVIPVGALDRSSDSRSLRAEARLDWQVPWLRSGSVLVGGEIDRGRLESRYFDRALATPEVPVGATDVLRTSGGLFMLIQLGREGPWTVMGGARRDWLRSSTDDPTDAAPRGGNDDLSAFSPTLGINVRLPRAGHAYTYYAGAFKAPTLEQLYDRRPFTVDFDGPGPAPPFVLHLSSHSLQPQRGHHVESGVRSRLWREIWADASAYYSRSRDEIGFDLANFRYDNIERSIHSGLELQLGGELGPRWRAQVSGSLTRARFDGGPDDGKQVNGVPLHQYAARLGVQHGLGGSVSLEGRYVRNLWLDEANRYGIPAHAVITLGLTQEVGRVGLFLLVRNLANRRHAETGYLTRDAFGVDLPLYYPGAGRSLRAGLRFPSSEPDRTPAETP